MQIRINNYHLEVLSGNVVLIKKWRRLSTQNKFSELMIILVHVQNKTLKLAFDHLKEKSFRIYSVQKM